uniref:Reverse transcriptase domain-containing protein n=1 Tax=Cyprinus carpio TaxID=7962 RepID=A0A8C1LIJ4_CYPCA
MWFPNFARGESTANQMKSALDLLLSVVEALRLARAKSKFSKLILLDLYTPFDTVNHQILLSTILAKGISATALQWFESYLSDRSFKVSWRGEASKSQHLTTGVPQGSVLGPLLFIVYMASLGSVIQKHGFSYYGNADDTQLYLSFHPDDPTVAARISACLTDISYWMKDHHLQLNLAKTELLVVPANPVFHHNFTIKLGTSTTTTARNLGVMIDDQLTFSDHIAKTVRSCRFALFNIKKIRPFLSEHAAQLLVQALVLSRLDYCNALLAGLPASSIKPLQLIQNAAARLIFNEPKIISVTLLFISLHWLPIAARIKFKALMFAYKTTTGSAPLYLNSLLQTYVPSISFRSASERRLIVPSQRSKKSLSRTFKLNVPSWWNDLPNSI